MKLENFIAGNRNGISNLIATAVTGAVVTAITGAATILFDLSDFRSVRIIKEPDTDDPTRYMMEEMTTTNILRDAYQAKREAKMREDDEKKKKKKKHHHD